MVILINTKPISSEYHSQLKREAKIKDEQGHVFNALNCRGVVYKQLVAGLALKAAWRNNQRVRRKAFLKLRCNCILESLSKRQQSDYCSDADNHAQGCQTGTQFSQLDRAESIREDVICFH